MSTSGRAISRWLAGAKTCRFLELSLIGAAAYLILVTLWRR